MNIAMFTNVYHPLVGGIERSIATFKGEFERRGHRILVVTPTVSGQSEDDPTVVHVPAIQNFNGTDFSLAIPLPGYLSGTLEEFLPDLVHSHHPFLLGDTALRVATKYGCPLVFTYHTMWEHYLHYAPADSPAMQTFVKRMAAEYCNLCDHVIVPSASIVEILRERGVTAPITVVPTGIEVNQFRHGDGDAARIRLGIPQDALVAGYIGRLGLEKNLRFLANALATVCAQESRYHALFVGAGELDDEIADQFDSMGLSDRLHMPGTLQGEELVHAYDALDVFVFSSLSETQGIVLAEAMAAGCPVVALDAPGSRDIIEDGRNGRLLPQESVPDLVEAIRDVVEASPEKRASMRLEAMATAERFSCEDAAERALQLYKRVLDQVPAPRSLEETAWSRMVRRIETEWSLWSGRAAAAAEAATKANSTE